MSIVLIALGEIATIIASNVIALGGYVEGIVELGNKGYKFVTEKDGHQLPRIKELIEEDNKTNGTVKARIRRTKGLILTLAPGINIIHSMFQRRKIKKDIVNSAGSESVIVPMTDEEKEQYARLKNNKQKISYLTLISDENHQEYLGFIGDRIVVCENVTDLKYEKLPAIAYTLDEVKKLNDVTTNSYRLGTIDDDSVAIIGFPNPAAVIKKVSFKDETIRSHEFIPMTEEEAANKRFTVYPYAEDTDGKIANAVEEIRNNRANPTKANFIPCNIENVEIKQYPNLRKILK